MSKTVNIAIDMDGVISNFSLRFSQILRELYGNHLPLITDAEMIKSWDWHEWYPLSKEEIGKGWKEVSCTTDFWSTLEVLDLNFAHRLNELITTCRKVNVYFITARLSTAGDSVEKQTVKWLYDKLLIPYPQVICCGNEGKSKIVSGLDADWFIDDKWENCLEVALLSPYTQIVVVDYPYNSIFPDRLLQKYSKKKVLRYHVSELFKLIDDLIEMYA